MAMEVVDHPANPRLILHETEKVRTLAFGHVMRDQAAYDEVIVFTRHLVIIAGLVNDRKRWIGDGAGGRFAVGIEIDPGKIGINPVSVRPAGYRAQHVALAEAYVQQPERVAIPKRARQEIERRP